MGEVDVNQTDLGGYIKRTLDEKHWSIRKAASKTGIPASNLSRFINRKAIANPKSETLDKLANGLGVDRNTVYAAVDKPISPLRSFNENNNAFDLAKAIDNHEYMTYNGKEIDQQDIELIKRILRNK